MFVKIPNSALTLEKKALDRRTGVSQSAVLSAGNDYMIIVRLYADVSMLGVRSCFQPLSPNASAFIHAGGFEVNRERKLGPSR